MAAGLVLYVPEAVGFVLFPRVAAAASGARDSAATRDELVRAHRALSVLMPLPVVLGMVWSGPLVSALLPAYRDGIEAMRLLALGALSLSVGTLPGYFMLASGASRRLLIAGGIATALDAALVFSVAARSPHPGSVAAAALAGYAAFALALVGVAAFTLFPDTAQRLRFVLASFAPSAWSGAAAFAACRIGPDDSAVAALVRSAAVVLVALPVLLIFARGTGLRRSLAGFRASSP
jgi:O-antigen/teichoic acid export membrane protein